MGGDFISLLYGNETWYENKKRHDLSSKSVPFLKSYDGKYYRLIVLKTEHADGTRKKTEKGTINDEKLDNNLIRAKNRVLELALCNEWDWFVTFTLNQEKYDRYNLKAFATDLSRFIRVERRRTGLQLKYLFVPEQHEDGAWHMHGFIKDLPVEYLREFTLDEKLPYYIRQKLLDDEKIYEWCAYREKFGFNDLEVVKDAVKASMYVKKYISKSMLESSLELGVHGYYASLGLKGCDDLRNLNFLSAIEYAKLDCTYNDNFCEVYNLTVEQAQQLIDRGVGYECTN